MLSGVKETERVRAEIEGAWRAAHLHEVPALTAREVAGLMGYRDSRSLSHALRTGGLAVAFKRGRAFVFPAFQFSNGGLIPACKEVNELLGAASDPVGVLAWWLEPNPRLDGQTPADAVATSPGQVIAVAQDLLESDSY